ncbi:hypothetical protein [Methanobrevibacter sp.]|uniref:hypothetical protein n=1 Tax=Methanobrevibacter sp. TaxID=66852 RepID=UPI003890B26F
MERAVWIILNKNFSLTLDGEMKNSKVVDKKFSPGHDLWTNELPQLGFSDEKVQKDYDDFLSDIMNFFAEPQSDAVLIDAKLDEESEYLNSKNPLIVRKIEEYSVDEIIE